MNQRDGKHIHVFLTSDKRWRWKVWDDQQELGGVEDREADAHAMAQFYGLILGVRPVPAWATEFFEGLTAGTSPSALMAVKCPECHAFKAQFISDRRTCQACGHAWKEDERGKP